MKYLKENIIMLILSIEITFSKAKNKMESFILGGNYTKITQFPHSVFLSMNCDGSWFCGSSVLTQDIVLTAAHCFTGCDGNWIIEAYGGSERLNQTRSVREIIKIIVHDRYNEPTVTNDIALGFMKKGFKLGRRIKRVIIRSSGPNYPEAQVAGWGIIDEISEEGSIILKAVKQKVRSCSIIRIVGKGRLCAETVTSKLERPSSGDSGSALITDDYQQIGLVSFRVVAYPNMVIYTDVSHYHEWLKNKTRMLFCC